MCSENSSVMSNDLQATKSGVKTGYHGIISQVPGLSPTINTLPEEMVQRRRTRVLQNDSNYVKLAKQGGHKGLLWHEETFTFKANSSNPPDWFYTASEDNSKPSLINSEEKKNPGAFQLQETSFWTESMSAWERDNSSSNGKEKINNVHYSQVEKLQSHYQHSQTSKSKDIVFDKKPAPVNMFKLLSWGYAEDHKPMANTDLSN